MTKTHELASNVAAVDGDVYVDGPNGVAYAMTPAAAAETSDRLRQGADQANGQRADQARDQHTKPPR